MPVGDYSAEHVDAVSAVVQPYLFLIYLPLPNSAYTIYLPGCDSSSAQLFIAYLQHAGKIMLISGLVY